MRRNQEKKPRRVAREIRRKIKSEWESREERVSRRKELSTGSHDTDQTRKLGLRLCFWIWQQGGHW